MGFNDIKCIHHIIQSLAPSISIIHFKNNYYIYLIFTTWYLNMFMSSEMVSSSDELMTISSQRNNHFCGEYTRKYCFGKILHRIHDEEGHENSRFAHLYNLWPCISYHLFLTPTNLTVWFSVCIQHFVCLFYVWACSCVHVYMCKYARVCLCVCTCV